MSDFNTDSLYKFLTTFGIVMIIFSIMYPMEKRNEIELKSNEYKKEISLNKLELISLSDSIKDLNSKIVKANQHIEILKNEPIIDSQRITNYKKEINPYFEKVIEKNYKKNKQDSVLYYKKKEIEILNAQINDFKTKEYFLLITGIFFMVYGFINWKIVENKDDGITKIKIIP
ncbi:hypothetical protein [Chishuiella changwenlii]|uniref:hypothetical protein n=1 Tax=Chishuiella changwenlii TaxID=1434701 RepID=UPI002FD9E56D